ncbi:MAG: UbiH/UbiF family hydroxylase, partial [Gammaproteobacteria bacterium]|nr:UbiH/UbiF family hydroxylase [Gammaproteobacteria bacterium]
WSTIRDTACDYDRMQVWEQDQVAAEGIEFDAAEMNLASLGSIASFADLQTALINRLKESSVHVQSDVQVADINRSASEIILTDTTDRQLLSAKLLVIAEGAQSPLREYCGFTVDEQSYGQSAVTATLATEQSHENVARQRFLSNGPLAFLPLVDGRIGLVWTTLPETADRLSDLSDSAFIDELLEASGGVLGAIQSVADRCQFPLTKRSARRYVQPRIVLVGDSAHMVHPMAGLGMNLGLADSCELVKELIKAKTDDADFGSLAVLRPYERQARARNQMTATGIDLIASMYAWQVAPLVAARQLSTTALDRLPQIKQLIAQTALMTRPI